MIRWFLLVTHLLIGHPSFVLLTLRMGSSNNNKLMMCARHQK